MNSRVVTCVLLLLVVCVSGYTTSYTTFTSGTSYIVPELMHGGCFYMDEAMHDMMPIKAADITAAFDAYKGAGFSGDVPLGGMAQQGACFDTHCYWVYFQGVFDGGRSVTFYKGINSMEATYADGTAYSYTPIEADFPKVLAMDGFETNWDTNYPMGWTNASGVGKRIPVMKSSGKWQNVNYYTPFNHFVCGAYHFDQSDTLANGGPFPTYPNGDIIFMRASQKSKPTSLTHCGQPVVVDASGNWLDVKCTKDGLAWYIPLIIAVVIFVVVVAAFVIILCCCLHCRNKKEKKRRVRRLDNDEDNVAMVPTQSQIGMSRDAALDVADDEEDDYAQEDGRGVSRE
ncbi:hypothetical protein, conserved [Angomonas deanei]|uniref:Uncharacterized protein n=1 Tax=Angomonas deanei TaxID=59799 RepID=A0A7G2CB69_9TRYP|nr:hypothetical protein, conserved [Angomonas deanei]